MNKDFKHSQFAHCESGVISSMLTNSGLKLSEPMVFGLTSTLTFAFFPIIKVSWKVTSRAQQKDYRGEDPERPIKVRVGTDSLNECIFDGDKREFDSLCNI